MGCGQQGWGAREGAAVPPRHRGPACLRRWHVGRAVPPTLLQLQAAVQLASRTPPPSAPPHPACHPHPLSPSGMLASRLSQYLTSTSSWVMLPFQVGVK